MRHGDSGWISLHPGEFFLLWSELRLGELPAVLGIAHGGRTAAGRAALVDAADRSLTARGLGTVARPEPDVKALLTALAQPRLRLDLEVFGGGTFRAFGASGPRGHVTAGIADGRAHRTEPGAAGDSGGPVEQPEVLVGPAPESGLVAAMADAVPPAQAGVGTPGNVAMPDFRRACRAGVHEGSEGFLAVLREARVRPSEANTFLRAVRRGGLGGGRFGASAPGRDGKWIRTPSPVSWVDTEEGRYALRLRGDWGTVTPVDAPRLLMMMEELAGDLS